jgi:hypothetical protein
MEGLFANPTTFLVAKEMLAHTWWSFYGSKTPKLQSFVIKALSQVIIPLACERNWCTFEFIHSKKCSRLTSKRTTNLVFVFNNLCLKEKKFDLEYKVECVECINEDE